jgi:hypothetical protein
MKKFSKLITETKQELWTKHPLVNEVDWDEIFKPLIEHIESNLISKVPPPGEGIFSSKTKGALDELIDSISEDYSQYFQNVVDDGSQESFFSAYDIKVNYHDIMDCIQPLLDQTNDVEDYPNWDGGYLYLSATDFNYRSLEEFIEDIEDIHLKLKMLNVDYKIQIHISIFARVGGGWSQNRNNDVNLIKASTDITKKIKDATELPGSSSEKSVKSIKGVSIFIYNKETVQAGDLD